MNIIKFNIKFNIIYFEFHMKFYSIFHILMRTILNFFSIKKCTYHVNSLNNIFNEK